MHPMLGTLGDAPANERGIDHELARKASSMNQACRSAGRDLVGVVVSIVSGDSFESRSMTMVRPYGNSIQPPRADRGVILNSQVWSSGGVWGGFIGGCFG